MLDLLQQMQAAAHNQNWEQIANLDHQLRQSVAEFDAADAEPAEVELMLAQLQEAKAIYTQVLFQCQRHRTDLKKQGQQLRQGQKATHSYLSAYSMA